MPSKLRPVCTGRATGQAPRWDRSDETENGQAVALAARCPLDVGGTHMRSTSDVRAPPAGMRRRPRAATGPPSVKAATIVTTDHTLAAADVVFLANAVASRKTSSTSSSTACARCMLVDTLVGNGANIGDGRGRWTLKAWVALRGVGAKSLTAGVPRAVSISQRNSSENTSDGFFQSRVCRGRLFNCLATAVRSARV